MSFNSFLKLYLLKQMDKGGMDEDEVKLVPQWKAKGIGQVVYDGPPSKQQSTLKSGDSTSRPADDEGCNSSCGNLLLLVLLLLLLLIIILIKLIVDVQLCVCRL